VDKSYCDRMTRQPIKVDVGERPDIFLIRDFLSAEECRALIEASEARGYEEAAISTPLGQVVSKEVRNNDRILWDDPGLAAEWWTRCRAFVPSAFGHWHGYGVNPRFRFYRYGPGQTFKPHRDGSFRVARGDESWLTFMVYLNSDFSGGRTRFWFVGEHAETVVVPETGTALVFMHERTHEGEVVSAGVKYVLRTDVMYRKTD
jgi:hypothetical protein